MYQGSKGGGETTEVINKIQETRSYQHNSGL
jgi:hypothetical protein